MRWSEFEASAPERAAYIRFGAERRLLRWAPATGVETLRHPDA